MRASTRVLAMVALASQPAGVFPALRRLSTPDSLDLSLAMATVAISDVKSTSPLPADSKSQQPNASSTSRFRRKPEEH